MRPLQPREGRLLAALILVVAILLVWLALVLPIARGFTTRAERRQDLQLTYARDERTIGQLPSIGRAAALQRRDSARFHLAAPDKAAATAILTERLGREVGAVGGELRSVEDMAAPPNAVRARVEARLTIAQITALLTQLGNSMPLLVVDALAIDANEDAGEPRPDLLGVRLEVSASFSPTAAR